MDDDVRSEGTPVDRWVSELRNRIGLSENEIEQRLSALDAFCVRHDVSAEILVASWQDYKELTVRRRQDRFQSRDLAVESFLIHNGVNVFGDIVCVAGRPEDLAQQGARFAPQPSADRPQR